MARLDACAPRGRAARAPGRAAGDRGLRARSGAARAAGLGRGRARPAAGPRAARRPRGRPGRRRPACRGRGRVRRRQSPRAPRGARGPARSARRVSGRRAARRRPPPAALRGLPHGARIPRGGARGRRRAARLDSWENARARACVEPFELLVVDDVAAFDPALASFLSFDDPDAYDGALARPAAARDGSRAGSPARRRSARRPSGGRSRLLVAAVAPQHAGAVPVDAETPLFAGDAIVPAA